MRYLARRQTAAGPAWWGPGGWGRRIDATVFNSAAEAAEAVNGWRPFHNGDGYNLEVFGGMT